MHDDIVVTGATEKEHLGNLEIILTHLTTAELPWSFDLQG